MHLKIDDYEVISQKYGSAIARQMVDAATPALGKVLREMDVLAKLENGEFVVMLPGKTQAEAAQTVKRMRGPPFLIASCRWSTASFNLAFARASPSSSPTKRRRNYWPGRGRRLLFPLSAARPLRYSGGLRWAACCGSSTTQLSGSLPAPMPRFQFSLARLLIAVTVAAVLLFLAVKFVGYFEIVIASVFWCILPTPLVVFAIYDRGDFQAFAIGALLPWLMLIALDFPLPTSDFLAASLWLLPMWAICGALAVATRRWIQANRRDQ